MSEKPWVLRQLEPYIHTQTVPMSEVTITHGKGKLYPPITLVTSEGEVFDTLVESVDKNTVVIKLNMAVSFTAYIY